MNDDHLISHCVASVSQSCHFASVDIRRIMLFPARHPAAGTSRGDWCTDACGEAASGGPECGRASGLQPTEASPRHPTGDGAPLATWSCPRSVKSLMLTYRVGKKTRLFREHLLFIFLISAHFHSPSLLFLSLFHCLSIVLVVLGSSGL